MSYDEGIKNILSSIKNDILDKSSDKAIDNIYVLDDMSMGNCFVCQPYGSQNFPDFLIFTNKKIIAIEIKYSSGKSSSPMWNSIMLFIYSVLMDFPMLHFSWEKMYLVWKRE